MNIYDFKVLDAKNQEFSLEEYKNHVVVIVNVASKCGFTPQYKGLEDLYQKYKDQNLVILGFPCNQFGAQEPGSNQEIQEFCSLTYNVTFPVLAKVDVNGENTAPIYNFLKKNAPGLLGSESIKWNFTKFLIGKDGSVLDRYAPTTKPEDLEQDIKKALLL